MGKLWVLAGAALLAACGGSSGAADPPGSHDLGHGVTVQIHQVSDPMPGPDGDQLVGVDVEYANTTDRPVHKTLAYGIEMRTADGREADTATVDQLPAPPKVIPPNGIARGWVVFDVPAGAKPDLLLLYGEIGDDPVTVHIG